eukprot:gnl/TRDRNA2_/TRDRNA2_132266_c0_seq4.p1 gnl/TRDRNA2_/TRDRNA2_132266_c0~~gnl/TRDRNA2_/TRDRNA2_132266_c0_seq4.p1  ORF type:complete len:300 (-),score=39.56 gnl/TRDRNA2_/TRDRNA2_132266_c0_seq4:554-1399(-)
MAEVLHDLVPTDYEPTEKEIEEYAEWLGFDLEVDIDLLWIAKKGLKAELPQPWRPCQTEDAEIFYFNFETGESTWDHPCDHQFQKLYKREKAKMRPCLVGTLWASVQESGMLTVSVTSIGGNELASLEVTNATQTLREVRKELKRKLGPMLRLVLPEGKVLAKADRDVPLAELFGMPSPTSLVEDKAAPEDQAAPEAPIAQVMPDLVECRQPLRELLVRAHDRRRSQKKNLILFRAHERRRRRSGSSQASSTCSCQGSARVPSTCGRGRQQISPHVHASSL